MSFNKTTIPKLPAGFVDCSYHNDVCSHFEKEWNGFILEVWIERDREEDREAVQQYLVCIRKPEESEFEAGVEFSINDISEEGLMKASIRIRRELYKLMKQYY
jgi:hypothetical protein